MSFEKIGDVLIQKDLEGNDDLLGFFELARKIIQRHTSIDVESLRWREGTLGVTVGSSVEASEIRLRHIQIERELAKKSGRKISRMSVRVL